MDSYIGYWATRGGRYHFVESEVTDRLVMRCGRQMRLELDGHRLTFIEVSSGDGTCRQCVRRHG